MRPREASVIESPDALRALYPDPKEIVIKKVLPALDRHTRAFVAASPFCVLGSTRPDGSPDLSPRGGAPGQVRVLDDRTLELDDRPGNNRLDTLSNLAARPQVALLFFVPGWDETLRVYGAASIHELEREDAKAPRTAMRIAISSVYFQCPRALGHAKLWKDDYKRDRREFPSLADIVEEQTGLDVAASTRDVLTVR
jgi:hypothetical protein